MVAAAAAAHAQVFRSRVDMVGLTVTVIDARGQEITGLTADDFAVYEDGVQQQVSLFGSEKVPLDVALVLDTSSSMHAVQPAVKKAPSHCSPNFGTVTARSSSMSNSEFRFAPASMRISRVQSRRSTRCRQGSTALYDGLYMSLQEFARERRQRPDVRRQALVVFSDGLDNASHVRFEDVSELARALDVTIYTVTMHDGQLPQVIAQHTEVRRAMWEMRALTFDTGGRAFFPRTRRSSRASTTRSRASS